MGQTTILKSDSLGRIELRESAGLELLRRNTSAASRVLRSLARHLARREAIALIALQGLAGVPRLIDWDGKTLTREWLGGNIMRERPPLDPEYFRRARRLLRQIHSRGIAHNDLAKESNCLCLAGEEPGFIDFQLAWYSPNRSRLFRLMAREDLRHLLKHKRYYCPGSLTTREHRILGHKSLPSRLWMRIAKPVYHWLTRSMLGRADREGAARRQD